MPDLVQISYAMRKYRHEHNMTQRDLAAYLNNKCTNVMVCGWEKVVHKPSPKWVQIMRERGVISKRK